MSDFFGNATSMEHTYNEDGEVETDKVENISVEEPKAVDKPEAMEDSQEPAEKSDRRGQHEGGQDYTYYGNF